MFKNIKTLKVTKKSKEKKSAYFFFNLNYKFRKLFIYINRIL